MLMGYEQVNAELAKLVQRCCNGRGDELRKFVYRNDTRPALRLWQVLGRVIQRIDHHRADKCLRLFGVQVRQVGDEDLTLVEHLRKADSAPIRFEKDRKSTRLNSSH